MLVDGIQLSEGSEVVNLVVDSGTTFPSNPNTGELFYKTSATAGLYVYDGSGWTAAGGGGVGGPFTITGDVTGTIDGGTDTLTLATVNSGPGSVGGAASVPVITVNGKGLVTSSTSTSIQIAETQITDGTLLARVGGNETITGTWTFSNAVSGQDPTLSTHLATKSYVDSIGQGLDPKNAVRAATTANITLAGIQTIDGVALNSGDRVLVKNQTTASQNGIYVAASGSWTRATDFDGTPANEVTSGAYTFVTAGTLYGSTGWVLTTDDPITVGTTALTFTQFNGAPQSLSTLQGGSTGTIVYQSAANTTAFSTKFTWNDGSTILGLGSAGGTNTIQALGSPGTGINGGSFLVQAGAGGVTGAGGDITLSGGTGGAGSGSGGSISLLGGGVSGSSSAGGNITITAGGSSSSTTAGSVSISGGAGPGSFASGAGGPVLIKGGSSDPSQGAGSGGNVTIQAGLRGGAGGTGGALIFQTSTTTSAVERFRIDASGAWLLASAPGSSGQVLTSNGSGAAPTWQNAAAASSSFTTFTGSNTASVNTITTAASTTPPTTSLFITVGDNSAGTPGLLLLQGGASTASSGTGAAVQLRGGTGGGAGSTTGGNVIIRGGLGTGAGGAVVFSTAPTTTDVERFRITKDGEWQLATVGGTSGQVLTSNGAGTAPTWQTFSASFNGGTVANFSTFQAGIAFSSTTSVPVNGSGGSLQVGYSGTSAITSTNDAFVLWANATFPLISGSTVNTNGTLVVAARNTSGAGIALATQNAVRVAVNYSGRIDLLSGWSEKRNAPSFSATPTIDCSVGNAYVVTMTANITSISFSNVPAAGSVFTLTMFLTQDATGGRTVTWPASVKWQGGATPTLTATGSKMDIIQLVTHDGGTNWYGSVVGLNY